MRRGGGKVRASVPVPEAGEAGTVACGLNIQASAVFMLVMPYIPVERCAAVIEVIVGVRLPVGPLVIIASVVCTDKTSIRVDPGPKSVRRYMLVV